MRILVVDGMGGGIGRAVISYLKEHGCQGEIVAVGTNSAATNAMLKAGADAAATGTNAVVYNCAHTDLIIGPIGIAFPNSMHGEISPDVAHAISGCEARKLLIPVSQCNAMVVGTREAPLAQLLGELMGLIFNERGC